MSVLGGYGPKFEDDEIPSAAALFAVTIRSNEIMRGVVNRIGADLYNITWELPSLGRAKDPHTLRLCVLTLAKIHAKLVGAVVAMSHVPLFHKENVQSQTRSSFHDFVSIGLGQGGPLDGTYQNSLPKALADELEYLIQTNNGGRFVDVNRLVDCIDLSKCKTDWKSTLYDVRKMATLVITLQQYVKELVGSRLMISVAKDRHVKQKCEVKPEVKQEAVATGGG